MVPSVREAHAGWDLLIASPGRFATGLLSLRYIDGIFLKLLLATIERQRRQRRGRAQPGRPCDAGGRDRAA